MKKLYNVFLIVIIMSLIISLKSTSILISNINPFLIVSIRFVLFACVIFLIFEKQILKNIANVYKPSIIAGVFLGGAFIFQAIALQHTSPLFMSIFFIGPFLVLNKNNSLNIVGILGFILSIIIATFALILENSFSPLSFVWALLSSICLVILIYIYNKKTDILSKGVIESVFTATAIAAVISVILFFVTKPIMAPTVSDYQKIHLITIIIAGTFVPFLLIIYSKEMFGKGIFTLLCLSASITALAVNIKAFSFIYLLAYIMLFLYLIPFSNFKKNKKGFSKIENVALIALICMIISFTLPFINSIKQINIVKNDKVSIMVDHRDPDNSFKIGNIYIKSINNKPSYIYEIKNNQFNSMPIR